MTAATDRDESDMSRSEYREASIRDLHTPSQALRADPTGAGTTPFSRKYASSDRVRSRGSGTQAGPSIREGLTEHPFQHGDEILPA